MFLFQCLGSRPSKETRSNPNANNNNSSHDQSPEIQHLLGEISTLMVTVSENFKSRILLQIRSILVDDNRLPPFVIVPWTMEETLKVDQQYVYMCMKEINGLLIACNLSITKTHVSEEKKVIEWTIESTNKKAIDSVSTIQNELIQHTSPSSHGGKTTTKRK